MRWSVLPDDYLVHVEVSSSRDKKRLGTLALERLCGNISMVPQMSLSGLRVWENWREGTRLRDRGEDGGKEQEAANVAGLRNLTEVTLFISCYGPAIVPLRCLLVCFIRPLLHYSSSFLVILGCFFIQKLIKAKLLHRKARQPAKVTSTKEKFRFSRRLDSNIPV